MGLKEWIIPQDKVFFSLLEKQSGIVLDAATLLHNMMNDYNGVDEKVKKMKKLEKQSDEVVKEIVHKLNNSFITPLDHEDISILTTSYDDVLDYMEGVAVRMQMFEINKADAAMKSFTDIILESVKEINSALKQMRKINQHQMGKSIEKIHSLENKSDDLYDNTIPKLFKKNDLKKILIMKEIYEQLEGIVDKCQDVGLVVQDIVMKNS